MPGGERAVTLIDHAFIADGMKCIPLPRRKRGGQSASRFPPPWSVEEIGAAFVVKMAPGRSLLRFIAEWAESLPSVWRCCAALPPPPTANLQIV